MYSGSFNAPDDLTIKTRFVVPVRASEFLSYHRFSLGDNPFTSSRCHWFFSSVNFFSDQSHRRALQPGNKAATSASSFQGCRCLDPWNYTVKNKQEKLLLLLLLCPQQIHRCYCVVKWQINPVEMFFYWLFSRDFKIWENELVLLLFFLVLFQTELLILSLTAPKWLRMMFVRRQEW